MTEGIKMESMNYYNVTHEKNQERYYIVIVYGIIWYNIYKSFNIKLYISIQYLIINLLLEVSVSIINLF